MHAYTELISFNWTFGIQLINTLVLCLLLGKFLVKPVHKMIQARQDGIEKAIEDAQNKNQEAMMLKQTYEEKMEDIKREGREIITLAKERADEQGKEIIDNAYTKTDEIRREAEESIEKAKLKSMSEAKEEIISMAMMIAEKIMEKELDTNEQRKIVDKIIREVGNEHIRING